MKILIAIVFACSLLGASFQASAGLREWLSDQLGKPAKDYGYWTCSQCSIPQTGEPILPEFVAQAIEYIKYNNNEIHQGEKVQRWIPNSLIRLCNGAGRCVTVIYQAHGSWYPVGGSYRLPPGVTPKNPRNQELSQARPKPGLPGGTVQISPIGPPSFDVSWNFTLPISAPRILTPSVTVIEEDGSSITYRGDPFVAEPLGPPIGETLDWGPSAAGLSSFYGGGDPRRCGAGSGGICYEN